MAVSHKIITRIEVDDSQARNSSNRLGSAFSRLENSMSRLSNMFRNLFIGGAVYMGVSRIAGAFRNVNAEIENLQMGISGLLMAFTNAGPSMALPLSKQIIEDLRGMAAELPGELNDYVNIYQQAIAPVLGAGGSMDDLKQLTRTAGVAGFALDPRYGQEMVARDIQQALTMGVTTRDRIMMAVLNSIGMTTQKFNRMGTKDRLDTMTKAFSNFEKIAELLGKTWTAQMATLKENMKEVWLMLTTPMFDEMKRGLIGVNEWFKSNKDEIKETVEVWGEKLKNLFIWIRDHRKGLMTGAGIAGGTAVAGKGASMGFGAASGIAAMVGGGASGTAGGGGIAASLGTAGPIVAGVLVALAAVGTYFYSLYNAAQSFGWVMEWLTQTAGALSDSFSYFASHYWGFLKNLFGIFVALYDIFTKLVGAFLTPFLTIGGLFLSAIMALAGAIAEIAEWVSGGILGLLTGLSSSDNTTTAVGIPGSVADYATKLGILPSYGTPEDLAAAGLKAPETNFNTNIGSMSVEVRAEVNEDPARVAVAMEEVFNHIDKYRMQARRFAGASLP